MAETRVIFMDLEELTLDRAGVWRSNGEEITHARTAEAFHRNLERDVSGGWRVRIGSETRPVKVEDTPRFVASLEGDSRKGFTLVLCGGVREKLDGGTLTHRPPDRLCCRLSDGTEARFLRAPYHLLLSELSEGGPGEYALEIEGKKVRLSR
ncbi:MAG: hypothetical protein IT285_14330 [Bdellovibrionales bacterium]|nr:hypothetical protein [Bdellovibrionales bacterium]